MAPGPASHIRQAGFLLSKTKEEPIESKGKASHVTFVKGQSGNPGGRAKVALEFKERARRFMNEQGVKTLVSMAAEEGEDRRFALKTLAEYAYGKPSQPIEQSGTVTVEHITDSATIDDALAYAARRRGLRAVS